MRKTVALGIIMTAMISGYSQPESGGFLVLRKIDSIRNSDSHSRHFASIYFQTTDAAIRFFSNDNDRVRQLMDRLETRFASYFFCSAEAFQNKSEIGEEWKSYYADPTASQVKCILYGINAHINGDIWQALINEFSLDEIRELKPYYLSYDKGLQKSYSEVYFIVLANSTRLEFLHEITLGADRLYGKMMLKHWRRRQIKMAELFYTDKKRFEKRQRKVYQNANRINKLINWYM